MSKVLTIVIITFLLLFSACNQQQDILPNETAQETLQPELTINPDGEQALYIEFWDIINENDLVWILRDKEKEAIYNFLEYPFDIISLKDNLLENHLWEETEYKQYLEEYSSFSISDIKINAALTFFSNSNIVCCTINGNSKYFYAPLNEYSYILPNTGLIARSYVSEYEYPGMYFSIQNDTLDYEAIARQYAITYCESYYKLVGGSFYSIDDYISTVRILEVRGDGNAFIFNAYIGFKPVYPQLFGMRMGSGYGSWGIPDDYLFQSRFFLLERSGINWSCNFVKDVFYYPEFNATHGSYFEYYKE